MSLEHQNGSKKWLMVVRVIMILLGIIQAGLLGWAKYITNEVIQGKSEMVETKSDISHIKSDVFYIRSKLDSIFELRRR